MQSGCESPHACLFPWSVSSQIHIRAGEKFFGIVGFHAASVQNRNVLSNCAIL